MITVVYSVVAYHAIKLWLRFVFANTVYKELKRQKAQKDYESYLLFKREASIIMLLQ